MAAHDGSGTSHLISLGVRAWHAATNPCGLQDPAVLYTARSMVEKGRFEEQSPGSKGLR